MRPTVNKMVMVVVVMVVVMVMMVVVVATPPFRVDVIGRTSHQQTQAHLSARSVSHCHRRNKPRPLKLKGLGVAFVSRVEPSKEPPAFALEHAVEGTVNGPHWNTRRVHHGAELSG